MDDLTKEQRDELRRLATAAYNDEPLERGDIIFPGCSTAWVRNREAYILTANPATALDLLDAADERDRLAGILRRLLVEVAMPALEAMRTAVKANPAMNGRQYDGLGIQVNEALAAIRQQMEGGNG